jgi:hypothetical protein
MPPLHPTHLPTASSARAGTRGPPSLSLLGFGSGCCPAIVARRRRCVAAAAAASPSSSSPPRALETAAQLAASRLAESRRPDPLFIDPFAELLVHADGSSSGGEDSNNGTTTASATTTTDDAPSPSILLDAVATRYLDECLLNAASATSVTRMARGEDYRQVVLLGADGGDCRPFRLPWPEGTVLFLVAPAEVHERAEALLEQQQKEGGADAAVARVPRGCLLRRVDLDLGALHRAAAAADGGGSSDEASSSSSRPDATIFMDALARAGFRGDRLSVWGLQGLHGLLGGGGGAGAAGQPSPSPALLLAALLAEVSSAAAFHSLVAGELPGPMTAREASNLLAEAGLLASVEPPGGAGTREYGRVPAVAAAAEGEDKGEEQGAAWPRLLFSAQQLRPSLVQMGIYSEHVDAMEGSDEDFGTLHFS